MDLGTKSPIGDLVPKINGAKKTHPVFPKITLVKTDRQSKISDFFAGS